MELDIATINVDARAYEKMAEVIEKAIDYFPFDVYDSLNFIGNSKMPYDAEIRWGDKTYDSLRFDKLLQLLRKLKGNNKIIGITESPVFYLSNRIIEWKFELTLVYDHIRGDVGIISLFNLEDSTSSKVISHGLGHTRGLGHHNTPIGLMYWDLIHSLEIDRFCPECRDKLKKNENV